MVEETNNIGGYLPTKQQEYLLKAALLSGNDAIKAWEKWKSTVSDVNKLDHESYNLFPLVYRNLKQQEIKDPLMGKLKSVYFYHWARNHILFQDIAPILAGLHSSDIKTMLLKGSALTPFYYKDLGLRAMEDCDIMVPLSEFQKAADFLKKNNWVPEFKVKVFDPRFAHALSFKIPKNFTVRNLSSLDLHCHVLVQSCEHGADDLFWEDSKPFVFQGVETKTLCPTDQLLNACVHGLGWKQPAPLQWIVDAMMILQNDKESINWERLVYIAAERGVTLKLSLALTYLNKLMNAGVPQEIIDRLNNAEISKIQRLRCELELTDYLANPINRLKFSWCIYSRGIGETSLFKRIIKTPEYLRHTTRSDKTLKIPIILGHKLMKLLYRSTIFHLRSLIQR